MSSFGTHVFVIRVLFLLVLFAKLLSSRSIFFGGSDRIGVRATVLGRDV